MRAVVDTSAVFNRHLQPYGATDELMTLDREQLLEHLQELYNTWGGAGLQDLSMLESFMFMAVKYPYDSPMHLFSLHRTYIGQLGSLMVACHNQGLFNTREAENKVVLWKIKQVNFPFLVCASVSNVLFVFRFLPVSPTCMNRLLDWWLPATVVAPLRT